MSARRIVQKLLIAFVAVVSVMAALQSGTAEARVYAVVPCEVEVGFYPISSVSWFASNPYASLFSADECPDALTIENRPTGNPDIQIEFAAYSLLTLVGASQSSIERIQFQVTGGDASRDLKYSLRTCADCADAATFNAPGPDGGTQLVDLTLPSTRYLQFVTTCVALQCPPSAKLEITSLRLVARDDSPPDLNVDSTPSLAINESDARWVRSGDLEASFRAYDFETGVAKASVRVDDQLVWSKNGTCFPTWGEDYVALLPCEAGLGFSGLLDLRHLKDGEHVVRFDAENGLGEEAEPYVGQIRLDNTEPPEIENLRIESALTGLGWTKDPIVSVGWADPRFAPENIAGAPLTLVEVDVDPLTEGAPDPGPVTMSAHLVARNVELPTEGLWRIRLRAHDYAGNRGDWVHIDVGLDRTTPEPPQPAANPWISLQSLISGFEQSWTAPAADEDLESGVCGYVLTVDNDPWSIPDVDIADLIEGTTASIHPSIRAGEHFVHIRSVSCAGIASATATTALKVDDTPPEPRLLGKPLADWPNAAYTVNVTATDSGSRVAQIAYRFKGGPTLMTDGAFATVEVPQGETQIEYWAIDNAGNQSTRPTEQLRLDDVAPQVKLERNNPFRPLELVASASDETSGIASASIEYRRVGDGENWQTLGLIQQPVEAGQKTVTFARTFDEDSLPPGRYEFLVHAVDVAGNVVRAGGQSSATELMSLQSPLRARTELTAGIGEVGRGGRVNLNGATSFKRIRFGTRSAIVGQLLDPNRTAIRGARLEVLAQQLGGNATVAGEAITDANGRFRFPIPAGASRNFTLRFAGSDTLGSVERRVKLRVRAALTFRASRRKVSVGRSIRFSGRLLSGGIGLPPGGKDIVIEHFSRGRWLPAAGTPTTSRTGRFSVAWSPTSAARAHTVYFHARVKPSGWPFETGVSKPVAVRIVP